MRWFAVIRHAGGGDRHTTMPYLLGLDHEKLTYRYSGRDFWLTDLAGVVAKIEAVTDVLVCQTA